MDHSFAEIESISKKTSRRGSMFELIMVKISRYGSEKALFEHPEVSSGVFNSHV